MRKSHAIPVPKRYQENYQKVHKCNAPIYPISLYWLMFSNSTELHTSNHIFIIQNILLAITSCILFFFLSILVESWLITAHASWIWLEKSALSIKGCGSYGFWEKDTPILGPDEFLYQQYKNQLRLRHIVKLDWAHAGRVLAGFYFLRWFKR